MLMALCCSALAIKQRHSILVGVVRVEPPLRPSSSSWLTEPNIPFMSWGEPLSMAHKKLLPVPRTRSVD